MWKQYVRILAVVEIVGAVAMTAVLMGQVESSLLEARTFAAGVLSGELLRPVLMSF